MRFERADQPQKTGFVFVRCPSSHLFDERVVVGGGAGPKDMMNLADGPQFEDSRKDLFRLQGHPNPLDGIPAVDLIPCQIERLTEQQKSSSLANSSIVDGHASEFLGHVPLRKSRSEGNRSVTFPVASATMPSLADKGGDMTAEKLDRSQTASCDTFGVNPSR